MPHPTPRHRALKLPAGRGLGEFENGFVQVLSPHPVLLTFFFCNAFHARERPHPSRLGLSYILSLLPSLSLLYPFGLPLTLDYPACCFHSASALAAALRRHFYSITFALVTRRVGGRYHQPITNP
jgi:hypothetical protein